MVLRVQPGSWIKLSSSHIRGRTLPIAVHANVTGNASTDCLLRAPFPFYRHGWQSGI
ncbi:hypothetical protein BDZ89DRAFT_1076964 [Hymenopellis radicata]|nr:hypothetical protein BDZ89DRAFT_1076964 [Hymenopellis radicata]